MLGSRRARREAGRIAAPAAYIAVSASEHDQLAVLGTDASSLTKTFGLDGEGKVSRLAVPTLPGMSLLTSICRRKGSRKAGRSEGAALTTSHNRTLVPAARYVTGSGLYSPGGGASTVITCREKTYLPRRGQLESRTRIEVVVLNGFQNSVAIRESFQATTAACYKQEVNRC